MNTVRRYTKEEKIGEGAYAVIYSGREYTVSIADARESIITEYMPDKGVQGRRVAIKKIKKTKDRSGIEISALREIKHLKRAQSENIIEVLDVVEQDRHIHIVLPYMDSNLEVLIKSKKLVFMPQDVKAWMLMVCRGVYECHSKFILHRDIKPNNVLIGRGGEVKLADFGLSVDFGFPIRQMTNQVITRWYKAPELLLGSTNYAFGIDIWALGCVFAELLLRTPYLPGQNDIDQLELIFAALGTPDIEDWPEMKDLPGYRLNFTQRPKGDMQVLFSAVGPDAIDLLSRMLAYNPEKRINIEGVLQHRYFTNHPVPTRPDMLPFDIPARKGE